MELQVYNKFSTYLVGIKFHPTINFIISLYHWCEIMQIKRILLISPMVVMAEQTALKANIAFVQC